MMCRFTRATVASNRSIPDVLFRDVVVRGFWVR